MMWRKLNYDIFLRLGIYDMNILSPCKQNSEWSMFLGRRQRVWLEIIFLVPLNAQLFTVIGSQFNAACYLYLALPSCTLDTAKEC